MYTRNLSADSAASSINRSSSLLAFRGVTVIYFPFLLRRTSFQGAPQPPPARGVPGSRFAYAAWGGGYGHLQDRTISIKEPAISTPRLAHRYPRPYPGAGACSPACRPYGWGYGGSC